MENNKYIKISTKEESRVFAGLNDRIKSGEIKWSHYAVENEIGYHYYIILK